MALICNHGSTRESVLHGALHRLDATPKTVHWGYFGPALAPAIRVKSGDLVQVQAVSHHAGDAPDLMMDKSVETIFNEVSVSDRYPGVHILTGPIYIEDAKPGDMLEVRYLQMIPRFNYGSNLAANWGYLYKEFGEKERITIYELNPNANVAKALYAYDFEGAYDTPGTILTVLNVIVRRHWKAYACR